MSNRSTPARGLMDTVLFDLRFAARSLRRRPVFAIVAIATVALAIGAATSIYSVVDAVLFRSLPYHDPGRLVAVWQTDPARKGQPVLAANWDRLPLDYTDFIAWRANQTSFTAVGAWSGFGAMLASSEGPEQISGSRVSPGLFEMLGVRTILGRTFLPGEDVVGGPHVTMLSYETWRSRFGSRRDVVGKTVRFDDVPYEIVGVLPEGFSLQRGEPAAPFWIPAGQRPEDIGQRNRSFHAIARLKPGVTLEQASVEASRLLRTGDPAAKRGIRITDVVRDETRAVRAPLLVLLGAVALLLLIACVNIATLLLGEAATRDMEMSARVALGATRGRLVRQLLTESLLLSGVGAAVGALLAWWGTKAIVALAPATIPGIRTAAVDFRILGVTLIGATITGVLFGLVPAFALSASGPATLLRSGHTVRGRGRLQRAMIATELALSVLLLVGAGLLSRSLQKLSAVDPGFRADHLLAVRISFAESWRDTIQLRAFYADAVTRLGATPGVTAATAASNVPFTGGWSSSPYILVGEGQAERMAHKHEVQQRVIAPNYFAVMGIPVLAGRAFKEGDRADGTPVAIISEAAARRDFPNETAVGKRVNYQGAWREIVGIVRDVKFSRLSADDQPAIYTPISQRLNVMDLVVRTDRDPGTIASTVRKIVRDVGPTVAVTGIDDVQSLIHRSFGEERFRTALIGLFGTMAAVLAAVGMFGVTARAVGRRTREVGIRVALGATSSAVVAMIVRQTMNGVAIGVAIGLVGSIAATRILTPYLFGVSAHDPATYGAIFAFMVLVSIIASWVPARRAGRVEPAVVLRGE
ncbi:MAG TPA: ABC transporter permease [Gemmatimonadaceae bacterium]|nr:ABC transporter permease [Gemmatimonadaceae bacterium]